MTPVELTQLLIGMVSAIGGAGGAVLVLRRRLSHDNAGMAEDRGRTGLISRLQGEVVSAQARERDALAEAQREREQRTDDARMIARLTGDKAYLEADRDRMARDLRRLVRGLPPAARAVLETDFDALGDP